MADALTAADVAPTEAREGQNNAAELRRPKRSGGRGPLGTAHGGVTGK
jgi:hypothetical protein